VAAPRIARTAMVVLVDTLKNLDERPDPEQIAAMQELYRHDYAGAVANVLPRFLFAPTTPPEVAARLQREFLTATGDLAAELVAPLYRDDYHTAARALRVPVRAINGDLHPTDVAANRRWFHDYDLRPMPGVGHYPMLEQPDAFTAHLRAVLAELPR
jgi:pimeloyl-ACP methyl ester carboxylesterase